MVMMARKVLSSGGGWIPCVWCHMHGQENRGYELYKSVFHEHSRLMPCDHPLATHINFVFCSERHKQYFRNSHVSMGNLPKGWASTL
jgi:hypothetical protein